MAESGARHGHQHDGHGDDDVIDRPCRSRLPELRAEQIVMLAAELSLPVVPARRRGDFRVAEVPRDDFGSICAAAAGGTSPLHRGLPDTPERRHAGETAPLADRPGGVLAGRGPEGARVQPAELALPAVIVPDDRPERPNP